MEYTIKNEKIAQLNNCCPYEFPKYSTQQINIVNKNAQATRPEKVGQMSDMFPKFQKECEQKGEKISVEKWRAYYTERYPGAIEKAGDDIYDMAVKMEMNTNFITHELCRMFAEDLIIYKTYNGLYVQNAILEDIAERQGLTYSPATKKDEAIGIDGYIGGVAYSVKPITYKNEKQLPEQIDAKMIFYKKTKGGIRIDVEE